MEPKAALEAISRALFPPPRKEEGAMVSADAHLNLEGVRLDLTRMGADPVCIRTIASVQQQLLESQPCCGERDLSRKRADERGIINKSLIR